MKNIGTWGDKTYWMPEDPNKPLRLTKEMKPGDLIYVGRLVYEITKDRRVFEVICEGLTNHEIAVEDEMLMVDTRDGGGVGILSLGKTPFDEAFAKHDLAYSSTAIQSSYTREQIDDTLLKDMLLLAPDEKWKYLAQVFYLLVRVHGDSLWDTTSTCWNKRDIFEGQP